MNPTVEPQVGPVAKQLDVVDHRHVGAGSPSSPQPGTVDLGDKPQERRVDSCSRGPERAPQSGGIVSSESIQKIQSPARAGATRCARPRNRRTRENGTAGRRRTRRSAASRPPSRYRRSPSRRPRAGCSPGKQERVFERVADDHAQGKPKPPPLQQQPAGWAGGEPAAGIQPRRAASLTCAELRLVVPHQGREIHAGVRKSTRPHGARSALSHTPPYPACIARKQ